MSANEPKVRAQRIIEKCQQYWNEQGICDAEIHAALEFIVREACEILGIDNCKYCGKPISDPEQLCDNFNGPMACTSSPTYSQTSELDADEYDAEFRRAQNKPEPILICPECGSDPCTDDCPFLAKEAPNGE